MSADVDKSYRIQVKGRPRTFSLRQVYKVRSDQVTGLRGFGGDTGLVVDIRPGPLTVFLRLKFACPVLKHRFQWFTPEELHL